jgi:hypothetical protein
MPASLFIACLLHAACLHLVVAQDNPTALKMAQTLINNETLSLITTGSRKPSFTGPKGSSKLITYWASGANVEKERLPGGGVKLLTPASDAAVTLKFSAVVTVRLGAFSALPSIVTVHDDDATPVDDDDDDITPVATWKAG